MRQFQGDSVTVLRIGAGEIGTRHRRAPLAVCAHDFGLRVDTVAAVVYALAAIGTIASIWALVMILPERSPTPKAPLITSPAPLPVAAP